MFETPFELLYPARTSFVLKYMYIVFPSLYYHRFKSARLIVKTNILQIGLSMFFEKFKKFKFSQVVKKCEQISNFSNFAFKQCIDIKP